MKVRKEVGRYTPLHHAKLVVEMYEYLKEQKESVIKGFEKAGIMEAVKSAHGLLKIFTQDARTLLTIGVENRRLIIDCLYSMCKRGTTY